ncbi:MAG: ester cyclase [Cyanobacteria bacterium K_Offshore_0m_m2_072]|nr:ester cyclase [Cyanobacteria bacterium K_Offshore_0m_m2_072]
MASANVDTAMQFYTVYNEKKLDLIDKIFTAGYVGHVNAHDIVGAENAKGFIGGFVKGIPDAFYDVKDVFESGDRVICRWTCTGTQSDEFYGMPATNNKVDVNGITIFRIEGDKIAELWNVWDQYTLVEQLKGS